MMFERTKSDEFKDFWDKQKPKKPNTRTVQISKKRQRYLESLSLKCKRKLKENYPNVLKGFVL